MSNKIFRRLSNEDLIKELVPFSLFTPFYEEEMSRIFSKVNLSDIESIKRIKDEEIKNYQNLVPHFNLYGQERDREALEKIVKKYKSVDGPCSMQLNKAEDLAEHMLRVYQVLYAHYVLAIKNNMNNIYFSFPYKCCGKSAINVMFSLIELGYPNAAYVQNFKLDHSYVILPFIIRRTGKKGTIVADPTSDELWKNTKIKPRNNVFLTPRENLEYLTKWKNKENLFPKRISSLCHIETAYLSKNNNHKARNKNYMEGSNYLKKAFSNPVYLNKF